MIYVKKNFAVWSKHWNIITRFIHKSRFDSYQYIYWKLSKNLAYKEFYFHGSNAAWITHYPRWFLGYNDLRLYGKFSESCTFKVHKYLKNSISGNGFSVNSAWPIFCSQVYDDFFIIKNIYESWRRHEKSSINLTKRPLPFILSFIYKYKLFYYIKIMRRL